MSNETFYIIMTPVVIGLFIYAYYAEKSFNKAKAKAIKDLEKDLSQ